jgi:hypothetical protein
MQSLDINTLPDERWDRRGAVLLHGIEERVKYAVALLRDGYREKRLLEECQRFLFDDLNDAPRADWGSLQRVWLFPWQEIQREMSEALNHALLGTYRAVVDNCRRALELALVGVYFIQQHVPETDGREWLRSERSTPLFSRALKQLLLSPRFKQVDSRCALAAVVSKFYWRLCDLVHVRGEEASFQRQQTAYLFFNELAVPEFSASLVEAAADTFIETTRHLATLVAIDNPVLLVGLDLTSKFGLNPPLSGFFEDGQAERIRGLLLESARSFILAMADEDEEVKAVTAWIADLPDLSSEQIAVQIQDQQEFLASMRDKSPKVG